MAPSGSAVPAGHAGFAARVSGWLRGVTGRPIRWSPTSAAKAAGAPIGQAEWVLAIDRGLAGSMVVATGAAVYCQDVGEHGRTWSRLGWEDVDKVGWDDRRRVLALTGVGPGRVWRKALALPSGTALAELARERVTATLLASTVVRLGDQACARVTARRQPGSGNVLWTVVLNGQQDTGDPVIKATVAAAIVELRDQAGISAVDTADTESWP
jgi:hypothetical protein